MNCLKYPELSDIRLHLILHDKNNISEVVKVINRLSEQLTINPTQFILTYEIINKMTKPQLINELLWINEKTSGNKKDLQNRLNNYVCHLNSSF